MTELAAGTGDRAACNENKPPAGEGDDDGKGDGASMVPPTTGNPTDHGTANVTDAMGTGTGANGGSGVRIGVPNAPGSTATDESFDE